MKLLIAGSRSISDYDLIDFSIKRSGYVHDIIEIVSGSTRGVDRLGEVWANNRGIIVTQFIPDWASQGKKAGILRNIEMVKYADAAVIIWDGESRGTKHTIDAINAARLPAYICSYIKLNQGEYKHVKV